MSEDPNVAEQIADNVEQAAQWPHPSRLWLTLAVQRKKLSLAARRMLSQGGQLALKGVPDLSLDLMMRLGHAAMLAQGAESWTAPVGGHRVHRYAFAGAGKGPQVLLLHGLGGSASSMAPLVPGLLARSSRVVLLDLPSHGRSPAPADGPLSARGYGAVVIAAVEEMVRESGGKVALVGNSLGGALALFAAHEQPALCAAVVGLNPAGAELSDEAVNGLPRAFDDPGLGAARMAPATGARPPCNASSTTRAPEATARSASRCSPTSTCRCSSSGARKTVCSRCAAWRTSRASRGRGSR